MKSNICLLQILFKFSDARINIVKLRKKNLLFVLSLQYWRLFVNKRYIFVYPMLAQARQLYQIWRK